MILLIHTFYPLEVDFYFWWEANRERKVTRSIGPFWSKVDVVDEKLNLSTSLDFIQFRRNWRAGDAMIWKQFSSFIFDFRLKSDEGKTAFVEYTLSTVSKTFWTPREKEALELIIILPFLQRIEMRFYYQYHLNASAYLLAHLLLPQFLRYKRSSLGNFVGHFIFISQSTRYFLYWLIRRILFDDEEFFKAVIKANDPLKLLFKKASEKYWSFSNSQFHIYFPIFDLKSVLWGIN